jgi:hypothetical protein
MNARIGKCTKCGEDAAWNTPHVDDKGNLFCNGCADESSIMLCGISQFTDENGNYLPDQFGVRTKNHCTIWINQGYDSAWTDGGSHGYKLTDDERKLMRADPEKLLDKMIAMRAANRYRCTGCGADLAGSEVSCFPLFAGVACTECGKKHGERIEHERKTGQVCSMCRQPYSLCCC